MPADQTVLTPLIQDKNTGQKYGGHYFLDDKDAKKTHNRVTIEDVVESACRSPKLSFLFLLLGVFAYFLVMPAAVYFPNFGGFVPYSLWRCANSSEECYRRTNIISDSGLRDVKGTSETAFEYRCMIELHGLVYDSETSSPTVMMFGENGRTLGSIQFELNEKDQRLRVTSFDNCQNGERACEKLIPVKLGQDLNNLNCALDLGHQSWVSRNASVTCNSVSVDLGDDFGVMAVVDELATIKLNNFGSYRMYCPETVQYNRANLCGTVDQGSAGKASLTPLKHGADFSWKADAELTFAIKWSLYCDREYLQTMVGSAFFGGGFLGALVGGGLLDSIGRKLGTLIGYSTVTVATFAIVFTPNISFLFAFRFLQGAGSTISIPGVTILSLEYLPQKYRVLANSTLQIFWSLGYLLLTITAEYLIRNWHWLAASSGILFVVSLIPLLLFPESPRFLLVNKNNEEKAKSSLRWLITMNRSDFDIDSVSLDDSEGADESGKVVQSFADNMRDVWRYKALLVQILILTWVWSVAGFLYYGFGFSWGSFGNNMYHSYMLAAIAEMIAYIGMSFPTEYWGRKPSVITFLLVACVSCVIAMMPYNITPHFTLEQLCCLIASMMISATFGSIYVYTIELAPTSHRGKILGWCSLVAQVAAALGPQASLLFNWNRFLTLALFSTCAGTAGLLVFGLPDTIGVPSPNTAREVQLRKDLKKLDQSDIGEEDPLIFPSSGV